MTRVGQSPETYRKLGKYRRQLASSQKRTIGCKRLSVTINGLFLNKRQEKNQGLSPLDYCKKAEQS